jgi:hypothetical protein
MTSRCRALWTHSVEPALCPRPRRPGAFGGGHGDALSFSRPNATRVGAVVMVLLRPSDPRMVAVADRIGLAADEALRANDGQPSSLDASPNGVAVTVVLRRRVTEAVVSGTGSPGTGWRPDPVAGWPGRRHAWLGVAHRHWRVSAAVAGAGSAKLARSKRLPDGRALRPGLPTLWAGAGRGNPPARAQPCHADVLLRLVSTPNAHCVFALVMLRSSVRVRQYWRRCRGSVPMLLQSSVL